MKGFHDKQIKISKNSKKQRKTLPISSFPLCTPTPQSSCVIRIENLYRNSDENWIDPTLLMFQTLIVACLVENWFGCLLSLVLVSIFLFLYRYTNAWIYNYLVFHSLLFYCYFYVESHLILLGLALGNLCRIMNNDVYFWDRRSFTIQSVHVSPITMSVFYVEVRVF